MSGVLLKRKQVAEMFGVQPATVTYWKRKGYIKPACYVNGTPRYRTADLTPLLAAKPAEKAVPEKG